MPEILPELKALGILTLHLHQFRGETKDLVLNECVNDPKNPMACYIPRGRCQAIRVTQPRKVPIKQHNPSSENYGRI
jgi:hypothetical protein